MAENRHTHEEMVAIAVRVAREKAAFQHANLSPAALGWRDRPKQKLHLSPPAPPPDEHEWRLTREGADVVFAILCIACVVTVGTVIAILLGLWG